MRSSNPALSADVFRIEATTYSHAMTLQGTVTKTGILLALTVGAAAVAWMQISRVVAQGGMEQALQRVQTLCLVGGIGGLIFAIITIFKPAVAPYTSPIYAVLEGVLLGSISMLANSYYPDIVPQAVGLTFGTLAALLLAYTSGVIRATERFKAGVIAATGAIFLVYMATFVLSFFGVAIPYIHGSGLIGIGFSGFVVVIAALNLVLDFDFIEQGVARGAPKYMEWYGAFGLLVTLVWLYISILRLLMKLQSRD